MTWPTVGLLLLGCAAFGALLGTAPPRVRTGWLVAAGAVVALVVFQPGICATAIAASVPYGDPDLLEGLTSCRFLYGPAIPELAGLDAAETGQLLQLVAAVVAIGAVLLVRRRRSPTAPRPD